eukprot:EG_transcript_8542
MLAEGHGTDPVLLGFVCLATAVGLACLSLVAAWRAALRAHRWVKGGYGGFGGLAGALWVGGQAAVARLGRGAAAVWADVWEAAGTLLGDGLRRLVAAADALDLVVAAAGEWVAEEWRWLRHQEDGYTSDLDEELLRRRAKRLLWKERGVSLQDFELQAYIGRGASCRVYLVQPRGSPQPLAMKVMRKAQVVADGMANHVNRELALLLRLRHPAVVACRHAFQTDARLFLLLDLCCGSLAVHKRAYPNNRFPEPVAQFYCAEALLALEYLHGQEVVYRDLKLDNLLLARDGHLCLADFNMARLLHRDAKTRTFCGTVAYMAPEMACGEDYGHGVDLWSLGVATYEMLTGRLPFDAPSEDELLHRIATQPARFPPDFPAAAADFIKGLLTRDPKRRPTATAAQGHPFLRPLPWPELRRRRSPPPITPSPDALQYFDRNFTQRRPLLSYAAPASHLSSHFPGYLPSTDNFRCATPPPQPRKSPSDRRATPPSPRPDVEGLDDPTGHRERQPNRSPVGQRRRAAS